MEVTELNKESTSQEESSVFLFWFRLAMGWRIVYGALKLILGGMILKWATLDPAGLFYRLMQHEIIEDPGDLFVRLVGPMVEHISSNTSIFIALYLLFWGVVDIFLSVYILKRKLWAFRVALWVIAFFIIYEIYRLSYMHSLGLLIVIVVDMGMLLLIWIEYQKLSARHGHKS